MLLCALLSVTMLAKDPVLEKRHYLVSNFDVSKISVYDPRDVLGILNFLMQYSEEDNKWNYEQLGLTWKDMVDAINGKPHSILLKFFNRFGWEDKNGIKVLTFLDLSNYRHLIGTKFYGEFDGKYFRNLKELSINSTQLTSIDLSKNLKLTRLVFKENYSASLDVSKNINLKFLDCSENSLNNLDLSKNVKLVDLYCSNNQLITLDLSQNVELEELYCDNNQLTSLDLSNNFKLKELNCSKNKLNTLDVSNNKLEYLFCYKNELITLNVSNAINLKNLNCSENKLTNLDVSNSTELKELDCSLNKLTSLNTSKNSKLSILTCNYNQLGSLDLTANKLFVLIANNNQFKISTLKGDYAKVAIVAFNPQSTLQGGTKGYLDILDLSSEYNIRGKKTTYVWYDKATKKEVKVNGSRGKFYANRKNAGKTLICEMKNDLIPDLNLRYEVTIANSARFVENNTNAFAIEEIKSENPSKNWAESVLIYPNPVVDIVKITSPFKTLSIDVYNYSGKLVKTFPSLKNNEINVQDLAPGIYIVTLTTDQGIVTKKIIKK
ncbi:MULTISPECIES: T9SS type A sorting domain-containing protein [Apibacter]|uniref:T9SS type A sorting domain-containing protein n=1 Tax=Apibacter TaxID=1778601 RepID=UPI001C69BB97|nr:MULTISPECIES: T9SS type A sorting domain-containing protein [Apibacter]QYN51133.1 T9SS type A sorting domain-containing protein [Apibacter sp. ESL0404]